MNKNILVTGSYDSTIRTWNIQVNDLKILRLDKLKLYIKLQVPLIQSFQDKIIKYMLLWVEIHFTK